MKLNLKHSEEEVQELEEINSEGAQEANEEAKEDSAESMIEPIKKKKATPLQ